MHVIFILPFLQFSLFNFLLDDAPSGRRVVEYRNDRSVICNGRDTDPDYDMDHDFRNDPLDHECDHSVVMQYDEYMRERKCIS